MATVYFKINEEQEKELIELMTLEGFTIKSAFFRFLIKFYKYQSSPDIRRLDKAAKALERVTKKLSNEPELSPQEMALQKTIEELGL